MGRNKSDSRLTRRQQRRLVDAVSASARVDFPDPTRTACPDSETLRRIAGRERGVDDSPDIIGHVATCSPCFVQYSDLRDAVERRSRITRLSLAAGTLAAACVLMFASMRSPAPPEATKAAASPRPANMSTTLAMTVDLKNFSPTRGQSQQPALRLPRRLLDLTLQLPVGMEPGAYLCRVANSAGSVIHEETTAASFTAGVTSLRIVLDLSTAAETQLNLLIKPPGLSWRIYPITVLRE